MSPYDPQLVEEAAVTAALWLTEYGFTTVDLQPADATRYLIVIQTTALFGGRFVVASNLGPTYGWTGEPVHWSYALEKWANGHEHTARVLADFLSEIAARLP